VELKIGKPKGVYLTHLRSSRGRSSLHRALLRSLLTRRRALHVSITKQVIHQSRENEPRSAFPSQKKSRQDCNLETSKPRNLETSDGTRLTERDRGRPFDVRPAFFGINRVALFDSESSLSSFSLRLLYAVVSR
jgi:hypothetical protein